VSSFASAFDVPPDLDRAAHAMTIARAVGLSRRAASLILSRWSARRSTPAKLRLAGLINGHSLKK
jgi:hypothetical protein